MDFNVAAPLAQLLQVRCFVRVHVDKVEPVEGRRYAQGAHGAAVDQFARLLREVSSGPAESVDVVFF